MKKEKKKTPLTQQPPKAIGEKRQVNVSGVRLLKRGEVLEKCGFSKATLRRIMKAELDLFDPTFPKAIVFGPDPHTKKHKYWPEHKIEAWLLTRTEMEV